MTDSWPPHSGVDPYALAKELLRYRWEGQVLAQLAAVGGLRRAGLARAITMAAQEHIWDAQLSRALDRLVRFGLVQVALDEDRGIKMYRLTPAGTEQATILDQLNTVLGPDSPPDGQEHTTATARKATPPSGTASMLNRPSNRIAATPSETTQPRVPQEIGMTHPSTPTAAGMYDYYLGGTAHSVADQATADLIADLIPDIADSAWANRGFLQRAVRYLADQGIRQFIDIGSGLPTQRNTHDVADPASRTLYVDIDPAVVRQAQQLLGDTDTASVIPGDVRHPEAIFDHPHTRRLIDLTQPVGLLLVAVLHFVPDDDDPWGLVARYRDRLAAGSYLAVSHPSVGAQISDEVRAKGTQAIAGMATPPTDRSRTEIERFFEGMQLVPPYPGATPELVHIGLWGADDPERADSEGSRLGYAALARIP